MSSAYLKMVQNKLWDYLICVCGSPMSFSSNSSSISKQSLASSSDACDSPVFSSKSSSKLVRYQRSSGVKVRDHGYDIVKKWYSFTLHKLSFKCISILLEYILLYVLKWYNDIYHRYIYQFSHLYSMACLNEEFKNKC